MGAGVGVSDNGDAITVGSAGPCAVGELFGGDGAAADGFAASSGTAVGDPIGEAGKVAVAFGDGDELDSIGGGETDAVGIAEFVGDGAGDASTVSDIVGDVGGEGVATIAAGLGDGVADDDCAAVGDDVAAGVGAPIRFAFGVASLCGLGEVLAVGFGDAVGVAVGVGVGEAVSLGVGLGVGKGCNHATGQRTEISVAVWPARALSMLAAGAKLPFAGSNSFALARGL